MAGPGEYVSDITEGITSVEYLPKAKIKQRSRKRKKQPCPRCGYMAVKGGVKPRRVAGRNITPLSEGSIFNLIKLIFFDWLNQQLLFL